MIYTETHFSFTHDLSDARRPNLFPFGLAAATADQLRATFGPFRAGAGTYELSGGEVTTRTEASMFGPVAPDAFAVQSYTLEGNTLMLTTRRSQFGPVPAPRTFVLTRVE